MITELHEELAAGCERSLREYLDMLQEQLLYGVQILHISGWQTGKCAITALLLTCMTEV